MILWQLVIDLPNIGRVIVPCQTIGRSLGEVQAAMDDSSVYHNGEIVSVRFLGESPDGVGIGLWTDSEPVPCGWPT